MKIQILTVLAVLVSVSTAQTRDRVDNRQARQQARIHAGKESGEITQNEAARLRSSKRAIRRLERRTEADGNVTPGEAARLERRQDARSRQIHRLKNNDSAAVAPASDSSVQQ
ncbi:MAG: hypothetical protein IPJ84_15545 [Bdellovibrionales bacterium]|nr:hypothetical protein [Bdellovibrionales bacterium]